MTWACKRRGRFLNWQVYDEKHQPIGEFVDLDHAELVCRLFNEHVKNTTVILQEVLND